MRVFAGDDKALTAARRQINDEYNKNKHVTNEEAINAVSNMSNIILYL